MIVRATELRHAYGDRVTLAGVSFELGARARVALTGRNGAGKTTLLRVVLERLAPDAGTLEVLPGVRIGALEQDPCFDPGATVADVLHEALAHVRRLEARLRELEDAMAGGSSDALAWADALEAFERAGGYSADARAARALAALDLAGLEQREAASLSGGERTRLALAAALADRPDLLVLDEPTNHLDIRMREWLESHLRDYPGAILMVSHDRVLLDAVATETWHLERGIMSAYRGGYSRSREQRLEGRRVRARQARLGASEVARLESSAGRVAAWGRNNDRLARRARAIARRAERARAELVEAPARERRVVMALAAGDARARTVVRADGLGKRYAERVILAGARLRVRAGDRIALLAPNGAGKTTLLRMLLGELASDDPAFELRFADGVQPAYFDQTYHGLAPGRPLLAQLALRVGEAAARALLGRYGFRPEDLPKRPSELSGGERARAGLALVAATRADLLVLDEPTNHLDVEALESLEEALSGYPGSLLFVTHDRAFAAAVATRVLSIEGARLVEYEGGLDGYARARRGAAATLDPGRTLEDEIPGPAQAAPDPRVEMERLEDRLGAINAAILRGGLSGREFERLRGEQLRARARLTDLYARVFAAPVEYSHARRRGPLELRADHVNGRWRFWAAGADSCPELHGTLEAGTLALSWGGHGALAWFRDALEQGAAAIAIEHAGARAVRLPGGAIEFSDLHARRRKLAGRPTRRAWTLELDPSFELWARARRSGSGAAQHSTASRPRPVRPARRAGS